jgi:hypothetical protein
VSLGVKSNPKHTDYTKNLEMLGRIGAVRLMRAFAAIPAKPASLRENIVRVVEGTAAAAARGEEKRKRTKRKKATKRPKLRSDPLSRLTEKGHPLGFAVYPRDAPRSVARSDWTRICSKMKRCSS